MNNLIWFAKLLILSPELDEQVEHKWGELDNDAETTDVSTPRLALCNMDWDRVKAIDIFFLFKWFIPSTAVIKSVTVRILFT